jgi:NADH-quinone oxidoreductase E subunit
MNTLEQTNRQDPVQLTLCEELVAFVKECRQKEQPRSYLIAILHKVQDTYGYLSQTHMQEVAELLGVPAAEVSGVATFYHFFRLQPQGKYKISICMGTACYVKGGGEILQAFKDILGIKEGETTKDGMYTLENTRCLGVCGLAPVVMINDKVYGKLTAEMVPGLINNIRQQQEA